MSKVPKKVSPRLSACKQLLRLALWASGHPLDWVSWLGSAGLSRACVCWREGWLIQSCPGHSSGGWQA